MSEPLGQLLVTNEAAKADFDTIRNHLQHVADTILRKHPNVSYPADGGLASRLPEIETFLLDRYARPH